MPKQVEFDQELMDQIKSLREDGQKWDEISNTVGMPAGKCMLIHSFATVAKKDRIKDATGEQIAKLRDEDALSWADISARTGYPHTACRTLYEEHTGSSTLGNRVGRGGRHPGDGGGGGGKRPAKKAAAKTGAAKKAAAKPKAVLDGMGVEDIKEALTGYAIKVMTDDGEEVIKVKAVKRVNKATIAISDEEGKGRNVKRASVTSISKNKVIK